MTDTATVGEQVKQRPLPPVGGQAPAYMSYSRMNSILTCGEQFRLERIIKVPVAEHWASIGGNAFHEAIEALLKHELSSDKDAT